MSYHFTVSFVAIITVVAELVNPFKEVLKQITGHHWVTKSVLSVVFFALCLLMFSRLNMPKKELTSHVRDMWISTTISFVILAAFFIAEYFI